MMTPTNSAGQLCDMNSAKVGALRGVVSDNSIPAFGV